MASLDFPSSPTNGQTYSSAGITWTYDSTYTVWNVTSSGPVGYSGSQGYTGSKGDIGYSGSLGYTGSAGTNGTNGYNGSQGYTGSASTVIGYTGSKGDIGYTGSAGTNGTNGYTGSAGTTGYTGSLGYSGSTASINWMYKTANYTAVNNDGILADTTSASFTVTLPASPATGTYVSIVDVTSTFATNPLTVAGNGQTLQGLTYTSVVLNVTSAKVDLIYEGAYWAVATTSGTRGYTGSSGVGYTGSASTVVGYTGSLGYVGSQGYNGSAGYTGSVGYTGSLGYTGSKGDIGYTGSIPAAITATSLALGGATLGTNNLAVTGTVSVSATLNGTASTSDTIFPSSVPSGNGYSFVSGANYWGIREGTTHDFNIDIYNAGSPKNVLKINNAGSTSLTGLLDLSGASAGQIKFPATQNASADANTLDDYEEGTWTPVITGSGGSPHSGYIVQVGNYTKTGRQVVANLYVRNSGALSGPTGSVQISGLPFTSANTNVGFGGAISFYQVITMSASHTQLLLNVIANTALIEVNTSGSGVGYANLAVSGWPASGLVGGSVLYNT